MEKFQSPQWGDNSKVVKKAERLYLLRFSPRNGEIILKLTDLHDALSLLVVSVPAMGR